MQEAPSVSTLEWFAPSLQPGPQLPWLRPLWPLLRDSWEGARGLTVLRQHFRNHATVGATSSCPFQRAVEVLQLDVQVNPAELARIPASGPALLTAHRPVDAADALATIAVIRRHRPDLAVLGVPELAEVPSLGPWLLQPPRPNNVAASATLARRALAQLRGGGCLLLFPSGPALHREQSALPFPGRDGSRLPGWLMRHVDAPAIPIHLDGAPQPLTQLTAQLPLGMRALALPRSLLSRRGATVTVTLGQPSSRSLLKSLDSDASRAVWLRLRSDALAPKPPARRAKVTPVPVRSPSSSWEELEAELDTLPNRGLLVERGPYRVYMAEGRQIPRMLGELGRLRELTFRAVHEGTGRELDLDEYDAEYTHLILVDHGARVVAGAYRLAFCDRQLRRRGLAGLYTSTLFHLHPEAPRELDRAIELGRSFLCATYQRSPLALAVLWRGIGEVLVRHPRYDRLIGAVSISRSYPDEARNLMIAGLERLPGSSPLEGLVQPRRAPPAAGAREVAAILARRPWPPRELSALVAELDPASRGLPVLIQRYLDLGARVFPFSVDPAFGDCLDGFVVVELGETSPTILKRFLGEEGWQAFERSRTGETDAS